jgi:excisionase family DNA binding protein
METTLYTVREAAKFLTLKESTVYRWLFDKKIRPVRVGTRAVRIPKTEIDRVLSEGQGAAQ